MNAPAKIFGQARLSTSRHGRVCKRFDRGGLRYEKVRGACRLGYQPLFGKGAQAPPVNSRLDGGLGIVNFNQ